MSEQYSYCLKQGHDFNTQKKRRLNLFFLSRKKEIPQWKMEKNGLLKDKNNPHHDQISGDVTTYKTGMPLCKIWVSEETPDYKRFHSFYVRLMVSGQDDNVKIITIRPFSLTSPLMFRAALTFLSKKDVLNLIDKTSVSATYLVNQKTPPKNVLKDMISVEKPIIRGKRQLIILN